MLEICHIGDDIDKEELSKNDKTTTSKSVQS